MRNAMPPPYPTPAPLGGGCAPAHLCVCARHGHIPLSSGTGSTHTAHAQARRERTHRRTRRRAIHQYQRAHRATTFTCTRTGALCTDTCTDTGARYACSAAAADISSSSGMNTNLLCASEVISPRLISMQFLVLFLCDPLEIGTVVVRANAVFMVYNIAVFVMRDKRPRNKQMNVNRPCFSVFCKSNLIISVYVYGWSQCVCFPCLLVDYYPCARILNQCCRQSFNSSKV